MTLDRRRTARHEAGHVAAIILTLGRLPKLVRADWPHELTYGSVVFPWPEDRATQDLIGEFVVCVLVGPLAVQQPDWPPTWPPDRDAASGDERQLGAAVSLGNIDEAGWDRLVEQATAMARSPDFNRLVDLIGRALELAEVLSAADLVRLLGPERLAEYGIDHTTYELQETTP